MACHNPRTARLPQTPCPLSTLPPFTHTHTKQFIALYTIKTISYTLQLLFNYTNDDLTIEPFQPCSTRVPLVFQAAKACSSQLNIMLNFIVRYNIWSDCIHMLASHPRVSCSLWASSNMAPAKAMLVPTLIAELVRGLEVIYFDA